MLYRKLLVCSFAMLALIQAACSIQVSCSGGGDVSESGSVATQIEAVEDASVLGEISITGADIKPSTSIPGPVRTFSQTHQVKDKSGKTAKVTVSVSNAPNGLDYKSEVHPKEGTLKTVESWVSAEQWLTVPQANSIKCTATASYKTLSSDAGIEELKGSSPGDYVTLTEYHGKAYASDTQVNANQTATDGSGSSIKIYNHAKDKSGTFGVDTALSSGLYLPPAEFEGLETSSSAGTMNQASQKGHIHGGFTSTAKVGTKTKTRTSNCGTAYDLNMQAAKGSSPSGVLGYYVNPIMATRRMGAIQCAINAAASGDTINIATGMYNEDININKALILKGSGDPTAKSFTLRSVLGTGSSGITAPIVNVTSAAKILDGIALASLGGTVNVAAGRYSEDVNINRELTITGSGGPTANSFTLNTALGSGSGGITAPTVNVNSGGKIQDGVTLSSKNINVGPGEYKENIVVGKSLAFRGSGKSLTGVDGGQAGSVFSIASGANVSLSDMTIRNGKATYGGGIFNYGTLIVSDCTISGNVANSTYYSSGGGIWNEGTLTVMASTVSGNVAGYFGGGIENNGAATVEDSTIYENTAQVGGGIHSAGGATVTGSTVYNNAAYSSGGGIANDGMEMILESSNIFNNTAQVGGGISNDYDSAIMTIQEGCTIYGNAAYSNGGGIANGATATILGGCTIYGNTAPVGGGIFNCATARMMIQENSTIYGNTATLDGGRAGGGIFNWGYLDVDPSKVYDNTPDDLASDH